MAGGASRSYNVERHNDALRSLPSALYRDRMLAAENLILDLST